MRAKPLLPKVCSHPSLQNEASRLLVGPIYLSIKQADCEDLFPQGYPFEWEVLPGFFEFVFDHFFRGCVFGLFFLLWKINFDFLMVFAANNEIVLSTKGTSRHSSSYLDFPNPRHPAPFDITLILLTAGSPLPPYTAQGILNYHPGNGQTSCLNLAYREKYDTDDHPDCLSILVNSCPLLPGNRAPRSWCPGRSFPGYKALLILDSCHLLDSRHDT